MSEPVTQSVPSAQAVKYGTLIVSSSPHLESSDSTTKIMGTVAVALLPALGVAIWQFGIRALILTLVCIAASVLFESMFNRITHREDTITDLSAVVTGILLAMNLPAGYPYWMAVIGCFVAIVIVKQLFGGIGHNFANPAITARIVLLLSFTSQTTDWSMARRGVEAADAIAAATPLELLSFGKIDQIPSYWELFLGTINGSMGETSALALLIGLGILLYRKVITPAIPFSFLGAMVVFSLLVGEDPLFHILAGSAMLGAIFMATDYATSPLTMSGKIVYGIGCGLLTMMIRLYGSYPEGVSFAILFMNILTPHIDNLSRRSLYGGGGK